MSLSSRKEQEREIRRQDIMDAAEELFIRNGIENTTMNQIANRAEYTKKTLYTYFPSKDDIYVAIMLRAIDRHHQSYQDAIDQAGTGYEKLYAFADHYCHCHQANPWFFRLRKYWQNSRENNADENPRIREEVRESAERSNRMLNNVFESGKQDGSLAPDLDTEVATSYFVNCLITIYTQISCHPEIPLENFYRQLELLLRSFQPGERLEKE